jgi:CHAT domain-containing protein
MADGSNLDEIRAARDDLEAVIEEIRAVPGYGDFLAPPTFDDVARAAQVCPVVYLTAAEAGGLALIVRGSDVVHVPLDALTTAVVQERARAHLDGYARYRHRTTYDDAYVRWDAALSEVTAWLWDDVVGPVLAQLREATEVVIVAGGMLGLLPLHAAWTPDSNTPTGRRYALDSVAVSYAPNARSLQVARRLAAEVPASRLLAVVEPWPVAASRLPMARYEALSAAAAVSAGSRTLAGAEATFLAFERAAGSADVLHLACHGYADLDSPLDSGLLLAGGKVTLRGLLELSLQVRLAVLSACETALPGTDLPDEVVALPTGLLQAGVAGVVASQWAVPDWPTAMLMTEFYRCWWWQRMEPAHALRAAQRWLRDTTNGEKLTHYRTAVEDRTEWLPAAAAEKFIGLLRLLSPERRSNTKIHHWGAFTHVGA